MNPLILSSFLLFAGTSWAQQTPEALADLWVNAIKQQDTKKLESLIHPNCPKNSVRPDTLKRMVSGEIPPKLTIETKELGPREALEKAYIVIPEKQLNLSYITHNADEKKKYGLRKGFPIAKHDGIWYFAVCMKNIQ